jgi:hypothetical protein
MKGPLNRGGGGPILNGMALCTQNVHMSNIPKHKLVPRACDPLWRLAEALGNTSESRALIGCFSSANYCSNCGSILY